ncbi:MAG: class I SAM-dependent methyltransferase [Desulfuromonadaceae bacterium]
MIAKLITVCVKLVQSVIRKLDPARVAETCPQVPLSTCFGFDRGTPIDRYYIENFYREQGALMRGEVLEVGDSSYSRQFSRGEVSSFRVLQHAALGEGGEAIIGDLTDPASLPAAAFDCFICAQTLQYTFEVQKAVAGAAYLLKPGGVMLATVPGISQISRFDADRYGEYWRFTTDSMARLFQPVFGDEVTIASCGNLYAATAFLRGAAQEDLPDRALLDAVDADYPLIITVVARKAG